MTNSKLTIFDKVMARVMGKSLYDQYPDLSSRVPISSFSMTGDSIASNWYQWNYNIRAWAVNPWVTKAVGVLANHMGQLKDIRVVVTDEDGVDIPVKHWINDLLLYPNPSIPRAEFWKWWTTDQLLGGEAGIELARTGNIWSEMWPRQPIHFNVIPDQSAGGARYQAVKEYRLDDSYGEPYIVPPTEFIHSKFYNPFNPWRGISVMTALRIGLNIDAMAAAWKYKFLANNARPDYAIISKFGMGQTEKDDLVAQITDQLGKPDSSGVIVLEEEVQDIKTFDFAKIDSDFLKDRELSRDEIGAVFGVPDEIMGYGRDTYENFGTADQVLWTLTMVPLIQFRDNALTQHFIKARILKRGQEVKTDLSGVPQLQEDITAKITQISLLWKMGVPLNQAAELTKLPLKDVPGGDVAWLPFNLIPVDDAGQVAQDDDQAESLMIGRSVKSDKLMDYDSEAHQRYFKAKQRRITQPSKAMGRKLKKYFQDQQNQVIAGMKEAGKSKQDDTGTHVVPDLNTNFQMAEQLKKFKQMFGDLFVHSYSLLMEIGWDELPDDLLDEAEAELFLESPEAVSQVREFLNSQAIEINDSTFLGLQSTFEAGIEAGENLTDLMDRVNTYYRGRKSPYQVERITRTTMTGIDNSARQEAWRQSGVVPTKEWISALIANRTRDTHAAAHGQQVKLAESFEVGGELLQYPGDPAGSAGNIINCLCTTRPVVEGRN